jgi:predicted ATPase
VARSLGLADQSARWAVASLSDRLAGRQLLLVLDQCEHLADGCAVMADALLRTSPSLRIIATSRHVLGVAGEVTMTVPPMTVPAEDSPTSPEELLRSEAVRLFADRAKRARRAFPGGRGRARHRDRQPGRGRPAAARLRPYHGIAAVTPPAVRGATPTWRAR